MVSGRDGQPSLAHVTKMITQLQDICHAAFCIAPRNISCDRGNKIKIMRKSKKTFDSGGEAEENK